jgi:hypothetical protein
MLTKQELEIGLNQFTGTTAYHRISPLFQNIVMTDGVNWLCKEARCYWLAEAIASHQPTAMKHRALKQAQFWDLSRVPSGASAMTLTCGSGSKRAKPVITQEIKYTDFPLDTIRLYCMPNSDGPQVILLPSEY